MSDSLYKQHASLAKEYVAKLTDDKVLYESEDKIITSIIDNAAIRYEKDNASIPSGGKEDVTDSYESDTYESKFIPGIDSSSSEDIYESDIYESNVIPGTDSSSSSDWYESGYEVAPVEPTHPNEPKPADPIIPGTDKTSSEDIYESDIYESKFIPGTDSSSSDDTYESDIYESEPVEPTKPVVPPVVDSSSSEDIYESEIYESKPVVPGVIDSSSSDDIYESDTTYETPVAPEKPLSGNTQPTGIIKPAVDTSSDDIYESDIYESKPVVPGGYVIDSSSSDDTYESYPYGEDDSYEAIPDENRTIRAGNFASDFYDVYEVNCEGFGKPVEYVDTDDLGIGCKKYASDETLFDNRKSNPSNNKRVHVYCRGGTDVFIGLVTDVNVKNNTTAIQRVQLYKNKFGETVYGADFTINKKSTVLGVKRFKCTTYNEAVEAYKKFLKEFSK